MLVSRNGAFRARRMALSACAAIVLALAAVSGVPNVPARAADAPAVSPKEIYFPINNMNIPVLQDGRSKGTLLFNFLVELTAPEHRPHVNGYAPRLRARFFDKLYVFAAKLKAEETVDLAEIKTMLTEIAKQTVGEGRVAGVLVKDYRRAYAK